MLNGIWRTAWHHQPWALFAGGAPGARRWPTGAHGAPERRSGVASAAPGEAHTSLRSLVSPYGYRSAPPPSLPESAGRSERERSAPRRAHPGAQPRPGPPLARQRAARARRAPAAPPRPCGPCAARPALSARCCCCCSPVAPVSSARGVRDGPGRRRRWSCAPRSRSAWRLSPQLRWADPGLVPERGRGRALAAPERPGARQRDGTAVAGALLPIGRGGGTAGVFGSCDRKRRRGKRWGCSLSRNGDRRTPRGAFGLGGRTPAGMRGRGSAAAPPREPERVPGAAARAAPAVSGRGRVGPCPLRGCTWGLGLGADGGIAARTAAVLCRASGRRSQLCPFLVCGSSKCTALCSAHRSRDQRWEALK